MICICNNSECLLIFWTAVLAVFTMVLAAATIFLVYYTRKLFKTADKELKELVVTSKSDFLFRLKREFFTDRMSLYFMLIDQKRLKFVNADISYFEIDKSILESKFKIKIAEENITAYELDNALLYHLETIGHFVYSANPKLIFEDVYELFSVYVEACGDNEAIMLYINAEQKRDSDLYINFVKLYKDCKKITENNINNKN